MYSKRPRRSNTIDVDVIDVDSLYTDRLNRQFPPCARQRQDRFARGNIIPLTRTGCRPRLRHVNVQNESKKMPAIRTSDNFVTCLPDDVDALRRSRPTAKRKDSRRRHRRRRRRRCHRRRCRCRRRHRSLWNAVYSDDCNSQHFKKQATRPCMTERKSRLTVGGSVECRRDGPSQRAATRRDVPRRAAALSAALRRSARVAAVQRALRCKAAAAANVW